MVPDLTAVLTWIGRLQARARRQNVTSSPTGWPCISVSWKNGNVGLKPRPRIVSSAVRWMRRNAAPVPATFTNASAGIGRRGRFGLSLHRLRRACRSWEQAALHHPETQPTDDRGAVRVSRSEQRVEGVGAELHVGVDPQQPFGLIVVEEPLREEVAGRRNVRRRPPLQQTHNLRLRCPSNSSVAINDSVK